MLTSTVEVQTPDGPMPVYVADPEGSPDRAVIVVQEAFGVNDHIEDVTRRMAGEGYLAVAPHLFHRSGGGIVPYTDMAGIMPHFQALSDGRILDDVDATLGLLASRGIGSARTGIVGFCFGGRVTFLVAGSRRLGAAAGFYGGGIVTGRSEASPSLIGRAADLQTPWLGLFGDKDAHIPVSDVEALRARLSAEAPVASEIVRYPEADHGFHCDARDSYEPESAADAWRRTLDWFKAHLA